MKKYNFAIIGITLLLSLSACNDWLDINPSDQVSSEKLFESVRRAGGAYNAQGRARSSGAKRSITISCADTARMNLKPFGTDNRI